MGNKSKEGEGNKFLSEENFKDLTQGGRRNFLLWLLPPAGTWQEQHLLLLSSAPCTITPLLLFIFFFFTFPLNSHHQFSCINHNVRLPTGSAPSSSPPHGREGY